MCWGLETEDKLLPKQMTRCCIPAEEPHQQAYAHELDDSPESAVTVQLLVCTVIYLPAMSVSTPCMLADLERLAMAV